MKILKWALLLSLFCLIPSLGHAQSHGNTVSWTETQNTDLAVGFDVFRSTVSGGPYTQINTTQIPLATPTYTDTVLTGGTTYYYVVTSVDILGIQSAYSVQVSAVAVSSSPAIPTNVSVVAK